MSHNGNTVFSWKGGYTLLRKKSRKAPPPRPACYAVVAAGGSSSRMQGVNKLFAPLGGRPLIAYTLLALQGSPVIDGIVIAATADSILPIGEICKRHAIDKVKHIVVGGDTRAHSVFAGLMEVPHDISLVAIHDAARPLVSPEIIAQAVKTAARTGAAAPAVPVTDTIKQVYQNTIAGTPDRGALVHIQTPQVFDASLYKGALHQALTQGVLLTDDCAAMERMGIRVHITQGAYDNIKVTTPEDLALAEILLAKRGLL